MSPCIPVSVCVCPCVCSLTHRSRGVAMETGVRLCQSRGQLGDRRWQQRELDREQDTARSSGGCV